MTIPEARKRLTHEEMAKLTEMVLAAGPFSIEKVKRQNGHLHVAVKFPKTGETKMIEVD